MDHFARIAFDAQNIERSKLKEIQPLKIIHTAFRNSGKQAGEYREKSYEENLAEFRRQLGELKERYRPFMEDHAPAVEQFRRKWLQREFAFRYEEPEDQQDFSRVLKGDGCWEQVTVPDYRGPIGRWTGFYRREFFCEAERISGKRLFLRFLGVDYIADVYLNGRFVGRHEGFFSPFEFDVTDFIHYEDNNVLVVEVKNDAINMGNKSWDPAMDLDGDKIYAATGIGWDDAEMGWHHCPPGAGIYHHVMLEERSELFTASLFARPDIDGSSVEAWVEVYNALFKSQNFELKLSVVPKNFKGSIKKELPCEVEPAGPGVSFYRFRIHMGDFKYWTLETPWLYKLRAVISLDGKVLDQQECQFGMRKIHMDESGEVKGTLYLNNQPLILRGANDMGHMQLCVYRGDYDQLIEDILIAKLANMSYYRFTQRPVQEEIYEYCDMLGMMNQTDLPLFGHLRKNQFCEAIRQSEEMERLIRSHPSAIMISYINEPFPMSWGYRGHRCLFRNELEDFFEAATKAVKLNNPDRIVKNVEGDYDPPTRHGLSDFHCYTMWYTNHAVPIGKLHKGYLPALNPGWKTGCGEYGTEGLDPLDIMLEDYPKSWVPESIDQQWTPQDILRAQSYSMHGDWYEEQHTIVGWIRESQRHQALATALVTDAFRRRADVIISTAVHLLIDAWPSGWMKTLVDYRRTPKPAYFAFQHSLTPLRVNLRTDRFTVYSREVCCIEAWLLNDTPEKVDGIKIIATVRKGRRVCGSYEMDTDAAAATGLYAGSIVFTVPEVTDRETIHIDAELLNSEGKVINCERLSVEAFEKRDVVIEGCILASKEVKERLLEKTGVKAEVCPVKCFEDGSIRPEAIILESWEELLKDGDRILKWVSQGTRALILLDDQNTDRQEADMVTGLAKQEAENTWSGICISRPKVNKMNALTFLARNAHEQATLEFRPHDFSFMYNAGKDHIDFLAEAYLDSDELIPLVFTYQKPSFFECAHGEKKKLPVVGMIRHGAGSLCFSTLAFKGLAGCNPVLDRFFGNLLRKSGLNRVMYLCLD